MTMALTPLPLMGTQAPREQLGAIHVRRGLTAMLRRRLPASEVEDVAQTVLCDALASPSVPTDPEELRRWLAGIARHKVADFHRKIARTPVSAEDAGEPAAAPPPFEARELLENVLNAAETRRDVETLQWLVREHSGERFSEIAEDSGVPAPVVRQRVSRLRRALRSRWTALLAVLVVSSAGAYGLRTLVAGDVADIGPDPSLRSEAPAASSGTVFGDWVAESVVVDPSVSATQRALIELEAKRATFHVSKDRLEVVADGRSMVRKIVSSERKGETFRAALAPVNAKKGIVTERVTATLEGDKLRVTVDGSGAIRGRVTAVLRRAP